MKTVVRSGGKCVCSLSISRPILILHISIGTFLILPENIRGNKSKLNSCFCDCLIFRGSAQQIVYARRTKERKLDQLIMDCMGNSLFH